MMPVMSHDTQSLESDIKRIDSLISAFKLRDATAILSGYDYKRVPAARLAQFAQLCRRVGLDHLSLKLFHPWIHDRSSVRPSDELEYATCLRKVGLIHEALRILGNGQPTATWRLHQAYCHIQAWDYPKANEVLESALSHKPDTPTSRLIRINLVAACIFLDRFQEALNLLKDLEKECAESSLHLLFMCHLLHSQVAYRMGNTRLALRRLEELNQSTAKEAGPSRLLIEKWLITARLSLSDDAQNRTALEDLRRNLRRGRQWETLRGLDLEAAIALNDRDLATRVFFGTPYPALRQKILNSPLGTQLPRVYAFRDSRSEGPDEITINGLTGENMPFKFGTLPYRAMMTLMADLYHPWSYYRIFDMLFSDQAFEVEISPKRVHQLARRIRKECEIKGIPLDLVSTENGYRLRVRKGARFIMYNEMRFTSVQDLVLNLLRDKFSKREFTTADVQNLAPINLVQSQRILRDLASSGEIVPSSGSKRHRAYRLKTG